MRTPTGLAAALVILFFASSRPAAAVNMQWSTFDFGIYGGYSTNRYHPQTLAITENPNQHSDVNAAVKKAQKRAKQHNGLSYESKSATPFGLEGRFLLGDGDHRFGAALDTEFTVQKETYVDFMLLIGWQWAFTEKQALLVETGLDFLGMLGTIACIADVLDDNTSSNSCFWYGDYNTDNGFLTRFVIQGAYRHSLTDDLSVFTRLRYMYRAPEVNAWFTHPFRHSTSLHLGVSLHINEF